MSENEVLAMIVIGIIILYLTIKVSSMKKLKIELEKTEKRIADEKERVEKLSNALVEMEVEKTIGFPWFAEAYAEMKMAIDEDFEKYLKWKSRPAYKASEVVRKIKEEKRDLTVENKKLKYINRYYESIFPDLIEYKDKDIDEDLIRINHNKSAENHDEVKKFLTEGEYNKLTTTEKNQLALNRYISRRKSSLEIGLSYERYIGYLYESKGYKVTYYGISKGIEDLGIDLICRNESQTLIIQCKRWADYKEIHENVVNQLFGTTFKYAYDKNKHMNYIKFSKLIEEKKLVPVIYTTTKLSERAKEFAAVLKVQVYEDHKYAEYPIIKCNMSVEGQKIYHLPFDQQYDHIDMTKNDNTFYTDTVLSAEKMGYRRAYRWKGNKEFKN